MYFTKAQEKLLSPIKKRFSVKSVKMFRGREGHGVNANLYENNKEVCHCDDDGNGGCMFFNDWSVEARLTKELKIIGKVKYDETDPDTDSYEYDAEMFVNDLINEALEEKEYKRKCKKHTLIITTKCNSGQYIEYKIPFNTITSRQLLEKKHGSDLVEIINERFI